MKRSNFSFWSRAFLFVLPFLLLGLAAGLNVALRPVTVVLPENEISGANVFSRLVEEQRNHPFSIRVEIQAHRTAPNCEGRSVIFDRQRRSLKIGFLSGDEFRPEWYFGGVDAQILREIESKPHSKKNGFYFIARELEGRGYPQLGHYMTP